MNNKSVIAYAEEKYRYCCDHELYEDARYWAAYIDGARAQIREDDRIAAAYFNTAQ